MRLRFTLAFCLISFPFFSQNNVFEGSLLLPDKTEVPYTLTLNIDSNYAVSGSSIILSGKNKIYHTLEGSYAPESNTLFFKEFPTTRLKSCPLFAQVRISYLMADIYVIAGLYESQDSGRCGSTGHINVICRNFVPPVYPKIKNNPPSTIQNDSILSAELSKLLKTNIEEEKKYTTVTSENQIDMTTSSPNIVLRIYDQQKIDRDKVHIIFNSKTIDVLELTADFAEYKITAKKGRNILEIEAVNEGRIAMNTSRFEILIGGKTKYFTNLLQKGEKAKYYINYE